MLTLASANQMVAKYFTAGFPRQEVHEPLEVCESIISSLSFEYSVIELYFVLLYYFCGECAFVMKDKHMYV